MGRVAPGIFESSKNAITFWTLRLFITFTREINFSVIVVTPGELAAASTLAGVFLEQGNQAIV